MKTYHRVTVINSCDTHGDYQVPASHTTLITWTPTPTYRVTCPRCTQATATTTQEAGPGVLALLSRHEWTSWRENWPEHHDPARDLGPWAPGETDRELRAIAELEDIPEPGTPGRPLGGIPTPRIAQALADAWPGDL